MVHEQPTAQDTLGELEIDLRELAVLLLPFGRYMDLERPFCGGERGDPLIFPAGYELTVSAAGRAWDLWKRCRKLEEGFHGPEANRLICSVRSLAATVRCVVSDVLPGEGANHELAYDAFQALANEAWDTYSAVAAVVYPGPEAEGVVRLTTGSAAEGGAA